MRLIVGVTGYAQHGKDTIGDRLVDRWGYQKMAFADGLRSMALAVDPIIAAYQGGWREDYQPELERLSEIVEACGWDGAKKHPEVRRFLQALGTEGVRDHIGAGAWINALHRRWYDAEDTPNIVITDVRFPNEAAWVHYNGGILLRVTRPSFDSGVPADHPSEAHIADLPDDCEIYNIGTIADLNAAVDQIMEAQ